MNNTIADFGATYIAPNVPTLSRLAVPNRLVSSCFETVFQFIVSSMASISIYWSESPGAALRIHEAHADWLMIIDAINILYIKPFEGILYRWIPFHPLYRFCWRGTCWVGTLFPTRVLASWSPTSAWIHPDVFIWLLVVIGFLWLAAKIWNSIWNSIWRIVGWIVGAIVWCLLLVPRALIKLIGMLCKR